MDPADIGIGGALKLFELTQFAKRRFGFQNPVSNVNSALASAGSGVSVGSRRWSPGRPVEDQGAIFRASIGAGSTQGMMGQPGGIRGCTGRRGHLTGRVIILGGRPAGRRPRRADWDSNSASKVPNSSSCESSSPVHGIVSNSIAKS